VPQVEPLLEGIEGDEAVADKAYNSRVLSKAIHARGVLCYQLPASGVLPGGATPLVTGTEAQGSDGKAYNQNASFHVRAP